MATAYDHVYPGGVEASWHRPLTGQWALGQPIVNRAGCRWHGLEKASHHLQISRSLEFLDDSSVLPPTRDEVERYGPDASIAIWMIAQWAATQATPYPRELYLMDLDIHTLPPIPVEVARRGRFDLHLARVSVKWLPAAIVDRVTTLTIGNCPELEWLPPLPERLYGTLSITSCPKLEMKKFKDPRETGGFDPQVFFTLYGGNEMMRQAQVPRCLQVVETVNAHMRILNHCRLVRSMGQDLLAEAFRPERIARRIEEFGIEAVIESMDPS
jgi:hypothetical protein